jgi:hypothetical protein
MVSTVVAISWMEIKIRQIKAALFASLAFISAARAGDFDYLNPKTNYFAYGVDAGLGETDNVSLSPSNVRSQTIAITDADVTLNQISRLFDANLKADFSYLDYLQGAYSPELVGRADGLAHVAIVPERLTWTFQDDFGQGAINAFVAPTPDNRQNINYVSTGPNLFLRFAGTGFLDLNARYARATYTSSPFDSGRVQGGFELGEQLSQLSSISINGDAERVDYENTALAKDFDRTSVYGHYELEGVRTELIANIGASRITSGGESVSGPVAKLELHRRISAQSKIGLAVGREFTDASAGFSAAQTGAIGGIITTPAPVTADSYTSDYSTLTWAYGRNRTTFDLSGRWEKDNYSSQVQFDQTREGIEMVLAEHMTRSLTSQVLGSIYRTDYAHTNFGVTSPSSHYQDGRVGFALVYTAGRALEFRLRVDHLSRSLSGDSAAIGLVGFHANTAFLTVGYRPKPDASTSQ